MGKRPARRTLHLTLGASAIAAALLPAAGCGGAMPTKAADAPPPDPEVDIAELDKAEWRITELFGPPGGAAPEATASPMASSAADAAPPTSPVQAPAKGVSAEAASNPDPCGIACNALASMERAARHLCEMAGPDEPRCTSARERVKNATDRVTAHCKCPIN